MVSVCFLLVSYRFLCLLKDHRPDISQCEHHAGMMCVTGSHCTVAKPHRFYYQTASAAFFFFLINTRAWKPTTLAVGGNASCFTQASFLQCSYVLVPEVSASCKLYLLKCSFLLWSLCQNHRWTYVHI